MPDNEPSPADELPPRIPRLGWAIFFLVAVGAMAFAYVSLKQQGPPASQRLDRYAKVPDFQFIAQDGTQVSPETLKGDIWVANFIFTRCNGPCPLLTSKMSSVAQQTEKIKGLKFVTFTVDPENDTRDVLREYAEKVGADPERWKFLTGPTPQIEAVVGKGFLQALAKDGKGDPMHSTRFVIVDRDGWMRAFPDGNDPEVVQKLLMDIGDILRESPSKPTIQ